MTEIIVPVAAGFSFWRMVCGDGPVSKATAKLIETIAAQLGQGMQSANNWLEVRGQIAAARGANAIESLNAVAEHESKLFKMQSQDERAAAFQSIQAHRRLRNIESVLALAGEQTQNVPSEHVSDKKVDPDWMTQFFNGAQDVSNEDMQKLWARLLAGEVNQPGSFKLRTLETLKSLSKEDGDAFARICSVVWRGSLAGEEWAFTDAQWVHGEPQGKSSPLAFNYSDCLSLEECGLISVASTYSTIWMPPSGFFLRYFGSGYLFRNEKLTDDRVQVNAGTFHLTTAGKELTSVVQGERSETYLSAILAFFRSSGWSVDPATPIGPNRYEVGTNENASAGAG